MKKYLADLLQLFDPELEEKGNECIMCEFFGLMLVGYILFHIYYQ